MNEYHQLTIWKCQSSCRGKPAHPLRQLEMSISKQQSTRLIEQTQTIISLSINMIINKQIHCLTIVYSKSFRASPIWARCCGRTRLNAVQQQNRGLMDSDLLANVCQSNKQQSTSVWSWVSSNSLPSKNAKVSVGGSQHALFDNIRWTTDRPTNQHCPFPIFTSMYPNARKWEGGLEFANLWVKT